MKSKTLVVLASLILGILTGAIVKLNSDSTSAAPTAQQLTAKANLHAANQEVICTDAAKQIFTSTGVEIGCHLAGDTLTLSAPGASDEAALLIQNLVTEAYSRYMLPAHITVAR